MYYKGNNYVHTNNDRSSTNYSLKIITMESLQPSFKNTESSNNTCMELNQMDQEIIELSSSSNHNLASLESHWFEERSDHSCNSNLCLKVSKEKILKVSNNSFNSIKEHKDHKTLKRMEKIIRDRDYERQNIYYKTLLRDFKHFIVDSFEDFISSNNLLPCKSKASRKVHKGDKLVQNRYSIMRNYERPILFIDLLKAFVESFDTIKLNSEVGLWKERDHNKDVTVNDNIENLINTLGPLINLKDFKKTQWFKTKCTRAKNCKSTVTVAHGRSKDFCSKDKNINFINGTPYVEVDMSCDEINSTFKVFSQKKMDKLFTLPAIKYLFKQYTGELMSSPNANIHSSEAKNTASNSIPRRILNHK